MLKTWIQRAGWVFSILLFVACAFYIFRRFEWSTIARLLRNTNLIIFLGIIPIYLIGYWLLRTLRWRILLRNLGIDVPFSVLYFCTAFTLSVALFTPGQAGEALKAEFLKQYYSTDRVLGYSSFIVERVLDLVCVLLLSALGLIGLSGFIPPVYYVFFLFFISAILIIVWIIMKRLALSFPIVMRLRNAFITNISHLETFMSVLLLTLACWIATALLWQISLASVGVHLKILPAAALTSSITLLNTLSMIPGSLGISEVGITESLQFLGFSSPLSQAGALILRILGIWTFIIGSIHLGIWRLLKTFWAQSK